MKVNLSKGPSRFISFIYAALLFHHTYLFLIFYRQTDNFFSTDFEADFSSADIFNSVQTTPTNNNCKQNNQNNNVNGQMSFANFDNNAIFNAASELKCFFRLFF